jgi:LacI family transcriptional regulator
MAIGAIRALNDAGKRVPEDISVIGFDGLDIGGYMTPRLSTIHQNVEEMARKSVQLLLENIEHKKGLRFITIPVTLKCRESAKMIE